MTGRQGMLVNLNLLKDETKDSTFGAVRRFGAAQAARVDAAFEKAFLGDAVRMRDFSDPLLTAFPAFAEATVRRFVEAGLLDCPLTDPEPPPVDRRKVRCVVVCDAAQGAEVLRGFWRVVYEDEYGAEWREDLVPLADCPVRGEVEQLVLRIVAEIAEADEMRAAARRRKAVTT